MASFAMGWYDARHVDDERLATRRALEQATGRAKDLEHLDSYYESRHLDEWAAHPVDTTLSKTGAAIQRRACQDAKHTECAIPTDAGGHSGSLEKRRLNTNDSDQAERIRRVGDDSPGPEWSYLRGVRAGRTKGSFPRPTRRNRRISASLSGVVSAGFRLVHNRGP